MCVYGVCARGWEGECEEERKKEKKEGKERRKRKKEKKERVCGEKTVSFLSDLSFF